MQCINSQKKLLFIVTPVLILLGFIFPLKCSSFCQSPSVVYENQFHLSGTDKIAGVVADRYLPVFSGGKYVQVADTYDNTITAEIILPDVPIDGVIDPDDNTKGWFLLKSGELIEFDMSSPEISLWKVISSYKSSGLVSAIDAGGTENPVVAVAATTTDDIKVYILNKNKLDTIEQTLKINETGTISDIKISTSGIYVLLEAAGKVQFFDINSGKLKAEGDAGSMPVNFALDNERKQILIANPGAGTITVLDAETLAFKKTINDPNLMTSPVSIAIADKTAYIGCGGIKSGIVSLDLNELVLTGSGASLSRSPNDLVYFKKNQALYFTDNSGLSYLFDDTCLRIQTRIKQGAWGSSIEVLAAPEEIFGVRVQGGTPPFDLPSTGSVVCKPDTSDASGRSFTCTASLKGSYPLYLTDGTGNSKVLMVRIAAPLSISPSGTLDTYIAGDPLVFNVSGGFSPIVWETSYGILSSNFGRTVIYFPPDTACEDLITVQDRTFASLYTTVNVTVPGIVITPAQRVVFPGETCSFTLIGSTSNTYSWSTTGGEITADNNVGQYKAPQTTGEYQIIVSNTANETAIAKVFVVKDQLTVTPAQAVIGRQEGMAFMVNGGKGPYTWSATMGDLSASTGSSVIYTSSQISGETSLSVIDTGRRIASAQITVQGDFRLSPATAVIMPDKEVLFSFMGASGDVEFQVEEGTIVEKNDKSALYKAPLKSGIYDIIAMDQRGYTAWSRVYVVNDSLYLQGASDKVTEKETLLLSVQGGVPPYSWSATQGLLSSSSGNVMTWIAPEFNTAAQTTDKVQIIVKDSMDSVTVQELEIISAEKDGECAYVLDNLQLSFPCVQVGNDRFKFSMNYHSGLTWELEMNSLSQSQLGGACLKTEDNLTINVSCCEYEGVLYSFSLVYTKDLLWLMKF